MSALSDLNMFSVAGRERRLTVIQGDYAVNNEEGVVITTVLGSCVAVCLHDPVSTLSGMNHFLLAEPLPGHVADASALERYGAFAMEQLINSMLKQGANRKSMRAHIYGGASMHGNMSDIGRSNARFARNFLDCDQIIVTKEDVGGAFARRVEMRARTGQIRCHHISMTQETSAPVFARKPVVRHNVGDVELF